MFLAQDCVSFSSEKKLLHIIVWNQQNQRSSVILTTKKGQGGKVKFFLSTVITKL